MNADVDSVYRRVVFGLGTGRSGTVSVSKLLDAQASASVTHERRPLLPWVADLALAEQRSLQLSHGATEIVGDVAYYYLPYVEFFANRFPTARFVCMRRDRAHVIDSMMRKTGSDNLWLDHDGSEWTLNPAWDPTMPSYDPMPKAQAIGKYWDEYNAETQRLERALAGRFRVFDLEETLNTTSGVAALLDFVGIPPEDQNLSVGIRANSIQ